ncbi:hypothetical protein ACOSQ2_032783 [Xanthoceras sorbifolium]
MAGSHGMDMLDFLLPLQVSLPVEEFEFFSILLWRIWFRRNKVVHGGCVLEADDVVAWAKVFVRDFASVNAFAVYPLRVALPSVVR